MLSQDSTNELQALVKIFMKKILPEILGCSINVLEISDLFFHPRLHQLTKSYIREG